MHEYFGEPKERRFSEKEVLMHLLKGKSSPCFEKYIHSSGYFIYQQFRAKYEKAKDYFIFIMILFGILSLIVAACLLFLTLDPPAKGELTLAPIILCFSSVLMMMLLMLLGDYGEDWYRYKKGMRLLRKVAYFEI